MGKFFKRTFWQAILVGLLSGALVVLFRLGINKFFAFEMNYIYPHPFLFLFVITLAGLLSGILVFKFAPETSGSGIPYVKSVLLRTGKLIRIRTIFVKFFAGVLAIGSGLSLGREGPSVQLGAGAGSLVGAMSGLKGNNRNKLIAAGAGAAIGATFNAPIAGAIFILEELIHKFSPSILFPALVATVTAATFARYYLGQNPAFNISLPSIEMNFPILIVCVILGILCGVLGVLFSKTIFSFNKVYSKIRVPKFVKPAIAGFITGLIGLVIPYILSSGNSIVEILLQNQFPIMLVCLIFVAKFFVTPICFSSGAAGGIFLPMLMLGAFLGYITGYVGNNFADVNIVAISALGMAGFLASVARTPITAVVMVFEMTGGYECILPLMLVAAIADMTAEKLNHKPIYATLVVNQFINSPNFKLSENRQVQDVMQSVTAFRSDTKITQILEVMEREGHNVYPVVAPESGKLVGVVTKADIQDVLLDTSMQDLLAIRVLDSAPVTVLPYDNLYTLYYRLHSESAECAIVVDKQKRVLGVVTRADILQ